MYHLTARRHIFAERIQICSHGDRRGLGQLSALLHKFKDLLRAHVHTVPVGCLAHVDLQGQGVNAVFLIEFRRQVAGGVTGDFDRFHADSSFYDLPLFYQPFFNCSSTLFQLLLRFRPPKINVRTEIPCGHWSVSFALQFSGRVILLGRQQQNPIKAPVPRDQKQV